MFLCYCSKGLWGTFKKYGIDSQISAFMQRIENNQFLTGFETSKFPHLVRKMGNYRVMVYLQPVSKDQEEHQILVFHTVFLRGDSNYNKFLNTSGSFYQSPPEEDIKEWLSERLEEMRKVPQPPSMSSQERLYIQQTPSFASVGEADITVYEHENWCKNPVKEKYILSIYELIYELVDKLEEFDSKLQISKSENGSGIVFLSYPDSKSLLLIDWFYNEDGCKKIFQELVNIDVELQGRLENIRRVSKRAYPAIILAVQELWEKTQNRNEANLSLSPEEMDILRSLESAYSEQKKKLYPLFINGRPGSGKSTLLQYLFAEHFYHYNAIQKNGEMKYKPVYLTYSEDLRRTAQENVKNILNCNARFNARNDNIALSDVDLTEYFLHFQSFLRQILPAEKRNDFHVDSLIRFPEFKRRFENSFKQGSLSDIGAEACWYILRSLIKGRASDYGEWLDKESYRELPKNRRTISDQDFDLVYDKVWKGWYKEWQDREKRFDEQDLALMALSELDSQSFNSAWQYCAVFCDEAQDFTVAELRFLLHLSLYSNRGDLTVQTVRNVPFAFAGDPFQTLSPTGFNWDAVTSDFFDYFIKPLSRFGLEKNIFNQQELQFNYRSSAQIVNFCNLIQLVRANLLGINNLKPQEVWSFDKNVQFNYLCTREDMRLYFQREKKNLCIIVPCGEEQEIAYSLEDDILKQAVGNEDRIEENILSPIRAKGLEFKRVVLYRFGEYFLKESGLNGVLKNLDNGKAIDDVNIHISVELFLNNLYVGASRAQTRLIIVDTEEACRTFWGKYFSPQGKQEAFRIYQERAPKAAEFWNFDLHLDVVSEPGGDIWGENADNPEDIARQFEHKALANQSASDMNYAASNYRKVIDGDKVYFELRAKYCDAYAMEFRGKHEDAGQYFESLPDKMPGVVESPLKKALENYWKAKKWDKFLELSNKNMLVCEVDICRNKAAFFMMKPTKQSLFDFLDCIKGKIFDFPEEFFTSVWENIFSLTFRQLDSFIPLEVSSEQEKLFYAGWYNTLEAWTGKNINIDVNVLAHLAWAAGFIDKADEKWEDKKSLQTPDWVWECRAILRPYPEKLDALKRLRRHEEIMQEYQNNIDSTLGKDALNTVFEAFSERGKLENLCELLTYREISAPNVQEFLLKLLDNENKSDFALKWAICHFELMVRNKSWDSMAYFFSRMGFKDKKTFNSKFSSAIYSKRVLFYASFVRALSKAAISDRYKQSNNFIWRNLGSVFDLLRESETKSSEISAYGVESFIDEPVIIPLEKSVRREVFKALDFRIIVTALEKFGNFSLAERFYNKFFDLDKYPQIQRFCRIRYCCRKLTYISMEYCNLTGKSEELFGFDKIFDLIDLPLAFKGDLADLNEKISRWGIKQEDIASLMGAANKISDDFFPMKEWDLFCNDKPAYKPRRTTKKSEEKINDAGLTKKPLFQNSEIQQVIGREVSGRSSGSKSSDKKYFLIGNKKLECLVNKKLLRLEMKDSDGRQFFVYPEKVNSLDCEVEKQGNGEWLVSVPGNWTLFCKVDRNNREEDILQVFSGGGSDEKPVRFKIPAISKPKNAN
jgi:hypothetical protein